MTSKKNKWRRRGPFEFRRETKRYSDGTPWGCDMLIVRIRGAGAAIVEPFDWKACAPGKTLAVLCSTYRSATPVEAAHMIRRYLTTA